MNGARKFHIPTGPAFNPGEQWQSISGSIRCKIVSVEKVGDEKWDYDVIAEYEDGARFDKNAWAFQVRYQHIADRAL